MSQLNTAEDDLRKRIELAKLDLEDLLQPSQQVVFSDSASDQEVTLLQLNKDVLNCIEAGKNVIIRGNEDDSAVLCTEDATYDIKNASTSNTLILLPDCITDSTDLSNYSQKQISGEELLNMQQKDAVGWKFNYLELKPIYPQINRLQSLLCKSPYKGPQNEESDSMMYSLSELRNLIQASDAEIMESFCKMNCCYIDGKWRMLDFTYVVECMGEILQLIDAESWGCGRIPVEELCLKINDSGELVPNFIAHHLLGCYGSLYTDTDGTRYCKLDERKMCRFFAEMFLKDVERFNLSEFMEVWKGSIPPGMEASEEHLQGLALIDRSSLQHSVRLFKEDDLPLSMEERFDVLFQAKDKWALDEITPYIERICLKGQTVASVLTKYARASTLGGSKVFCSRKPLK